MPAKTQAVAVLETGVSSTRSLAKIKAREELKHEFVGVVKIGKVRVMVGVSDKSKLVYCGSKTRFAEDKNINDIKISKLTKRATRRYKGRRSKARFAEDKSINDIKISKYKGSYK